MISARACVMNVRLKACIQGFEQEFIRQADEVKVFETFGGDLPVFWQANRKPLRKMAGRPVRQTCGRLPQS